MKKILSICIICTMLLGLFTLVPVSAAEPELVFDLDFSNYDGTAASLANRAGTETTFEFITAPTLQKMDSMLGETQYLTFADYPVSGSSTGVNTGIQVKDESLINLDAMSMEAWVYFGRFREGASSDELSSLVTITDGSGDGGRALETMIVAGSRNYDLALRPGGGIFNDNYRSNISNYAEQWTHVVFTRQWDAAQSQWVFNTYFDGQKLNEFSGAEAGNKIDESGKFLHIGGGPGAGQRGFYGSIASFQVYNGILDEAQILEDYQSQREGFIQLADTMQVTNCSVQDNATVSNTAGQISLTFNNYANYEDYLNNITLTYADGSPIQGGAYAIADSSVSNKVAVKYGKLAPNAEYLLTVPSTLVSINGKACDFYEIHFTTNDGTIIDEEFDGPEWEVGKPAPAINGFRSEMEGKGDISVKEIEGSEDGTPTEKYVSVNSGELNKNSKFFYDLPSEFTDGQLIIEAKLRPSGGANNSNRDALAIYGDGTFKTVTLTQAKITYDTNGNGYGDTMSVAFPENDKDANGFYYVRVVLKKTADEGIVGEIYNIFPGKEDNTRYNLSKPKGGAMSYVDTIMLAHSYPTDAGHFTDFSDVGSLKIYMASAPSILYTDTLQFNPTQKEVKVVFDDDMNAQTITDNAISLTDAVTGEAIAHTVGYDEATRTATLYLEEYLQYGTEYTIGLSESVMSSGGMAAQSTTTNFTTANYEATAQASFTNQNGDEITSLKDATSVTANIEVSNAAATDKTVMAIVGLYDQDNRITKITTATNTIPASDTATLSALLENVAPKEGDKVIVYVWDTTQAAYKTITFNPIQLNY